ncbi:hypothetical protein APA386B_437 [Acetobacter pasteurianus 386B]|nr:hypothetical protein APA386B_437 [Acetobacter pasteurianus 386B]
MLRAPLLKYKKAGYPEAYATPQVTRPLALPLMMMHA